MRYHYEKPSLYSSEHGITYYCDHPVYNKCTLYVINNKGLAVIQQRFNSIKKTTWWSEIDKWLVDDIFKNKNFIEYFNKYSGIPDANGLYPTVSVRQIMWGLKMKPMIRKRWETVFDRKDI